MFPGDSDGKEYACQCRRCGFDPWVGKIPWRREWLPTPLFFPGEFHGQRILAGSSPWGRKESDTTEQLTLSLYFYFPFAVLQAPVTLSRTHFIFEIPLHSLDPNNRVTKTQVCIENWCSLLFFFWLWFLAY